MVSHDVGESHCAKQMLLLIDMVDAIVADFAHRNISIKTNALLLVNGFGATPLMGFYLIYNTAETLLKAHSVNIARSCLEIMSSR